MIFYTTNRTIFINTNNRHCKYVFTRFPSPFLPKYLLSLRSRFIRNSTVEFLIFKVESQDQGVEVVYNDETIWATQKAMSELFGVGVPTISKHLKNIFEENELQEVSVVSRMEITASDGKRYNTLFYNLDAIISVGYRINSIRATQFRQWCTTVLRQFDSGACRRKEGTHGIGDLGKCAGRKFVPF